MISSDYQDDYLIRAQVFGQTPHVSSDNAAGAAAGTTAPGHAYFVRGPPRERYRHT